MASVKPVKWSFRTLGGLQELQNSGRTRGSSGQRENQRNFRTVGEPEELPDSGKTRGTSGQWENQRSFRTVGKPEELQDSVRTRGTSGQWKNQRSFRTAGEPEELRDSGRTRGATGQWESQRSFRTVEEPEELQVSGRTRGVSGQWENQRSFRTAGEPEKLQDSGRTRGTSGQWENQRNFRTAGEPEELQVSVRTRGTSDQWENSEDLETALQTSETPAELILDILRKTCLHSICRGNPPSVKYRRLFLSQLIKRHELTAAEPLDELYDALAEVVAAEEEPVCYKTYLLPSGEPVSIEENVAVISEGTTGLVTWEAALYLSEWALENPHIFTGRTVLELGSGAGLTGIVVCRACKPSKYVFSDCHQSVLHRLRNNIQHNGLTEQDGPSGSACVEELDWEHAGEEQLQKIGANTVIAADVVYDPDIIGCLASLLVKLLNRKPEESHPEVYIASTIRNPKTYDCFKNELEKAGLKHLVLSHPVPHIFPYSRVSSIEMIKIHR